MSTPTDTYYYITSRQGTVPLHNIASAISVEGSRTMQEMRQTIEQHPSLQVKYEDSDSLIVVSRESTSMISQLIANLFISRKTES